jgi:hypothetical protein
MTLPLFVDNWFENQIGGFQLGRIELLKIDFFFLFLFFFPGGKPGWFYERIRGRFLG